jgi:hypothetical protein
MLIPTESLVVEPAVRPSVIQSPKFTSMTKYPVSMDHRSRNTHEQFNMDLKRGIIYINVILFPKRATEIQWVTLRIVAETIADRSVHF